MPINFRLIADPSSLAIETPSLDNVQYVSTRGSDSNDGLSPGNAKLTLATSLATMPASGGAVIIAPGTYDTAVAITVPDNVTVMAAIPRLTTIRATAVTGASSWLGHVLIRDAAGIATRTNTQFHGIVFDANNQVARPCLTLGGFTNASFYDCQFKGGGIGAVGNVVVIGGNTSSPLGPVSSRLLFDHCEFGPSQTHNLTFGGGLGVTVPTLTGITFRSCYIHDADADGIANFMSGRRTIRKVLFDNCWFRNNAITQTGGGAAHINDRNRQGWDAIEVGHCFFDIAGSDSCGGFSDHKGRNIKFHHNTVDLQNANIWPIAIGDTNGGTDWTRFCWIEDNFFTNCNTYDYDHCIDVFIRRNVFYRIYGRPLGGFGGKVRNFVEDNEFIECGQGTITQPYQSSAISLSTGITARRNKFIDEQGTPTMLYGIYEIDGGDATQDSLYEDNDFTGIGTPIRYSTFYDTKRTMRGNKGVNPVGAAAVVLGASPYTYTAGTSPEVLYLRDGGTGGCNVSKNGEQLAAIPAGAGPPTTINLEPREQVVITYPGTAPVAKKDVR